jgi:hypothetical protein
MTLKREDVIIVKEEEGTEGGTTYYIARKNDPDRYARALCFRLSHDPEHIGERCSKSAGYKTTHVGTGPCHLHGGGNLVPIKTGGSAYVTKSRLSDKINTYLNEDAEKQYDLTKELAAMRATLDEFLDVMSSPYGTEQEKQKYGNDIIRLSMLVTTIGTLVEKISKINSRNTLTAAQALFIKAIVADILIKYVKDPDARERAVRELTSRFGGGEGVPITVGIINKYEVLERDKNGQ